MEEKIQQIQCLICDVDGVLTDGFLYLDTAGRESRAFHVHDGVGLKLLIAAGIKVAIITTTNNQIIDERMTQLGIDHYYKGDINKQHAYNDLKASLSLPDNAFGYVGDDLPDLPIIKQVGFGVAVADAQDAVKASADWQTTKPGGHGGVRELCDLILNTQGKMNIAIENLLNKA